MKCYHEEKGTSFNELHNKKPDPDCTCDAGTEGPAGDPELLAKSKPPLAHPETPAPAGPAADPELLAKRREPLKHPETRVPAGPAADPELLARRKEPLKHPETPEATGPAR